MEESLLENITRETVSVGAATSGPMDVYTLENGRMANTMAKELTFIPMDMSIPELMGSCQVRLLTPNVIFQRMTKYAASVYLDSVEAKRGWCCHGQAGRKPMQIIRCRNCAEGNSSKPGPKPHAQDQKRATIPASPPSRAPAFCILMLGGSRDHRVTIIDTQNLVIARKFRPIWPYAIWKSNFNENLSLR